MAIKIYHFFLGVLARPKYVPPQKPQRAETTRATMSAETLHKQLQRAIRQGELSTIARICVSNPKAPALLVSRDFTGNCPIHYAALHGHVDLMKLLVKMGADVDKENEYGWTALMLAAYHGHTPVVDFLIHVKSVNADKVNILGLSALKCAIYQRQEGATQLLLDRGVELNEGGADGLGLTPLMIACHVKNHSAVSCLLHSGADCNYQSKSNGWTALFYAIHPDDYSLVKILLNARAEPKLQDWMGRTAISYAKEMGCDLEALFGASSSGPSAPGGSGLQKVTDGFMGLKFTKGLERQSTSESMQSGRPTSVGFF